MSKEITCHNCGKLYWNDWPNCPKCGQATNTSAAAFVPSTTPPSLESQMTTHPARSQSSAAETGETVWPSRGKPADESEMTVWPSRRGADWDSDKTVYDRPQTGLMGWLIVIEGSRRGQIHQIQDGTTIGRDSAQLIIRDSKLSRPHAKFTIQNDQFVVWDFGSANGTYVNNEQIDRATPLTENDVIKMGDTVFVLKTIQ